MRCSRRHRFCCLAPIAILICLSCSHRSLLGADVHLSWNSSSASDLAGYKVYYGTAARAYGTPVDLGNVTTGILTGFGAGTYYFAVTAYDTSGNESTFSSEASLTISSTPPEDTVAPVISGINSSSLTSSGANITWTTNEASDSQVQYGTTISYGSSTALVSTLVTSHSASLSGLQVSTLYHYRVKSKDTAGNLATSTDFTFTTAAPADATPPTISAVGAFSITASGATVRWTTSEASTTQVDYGTTSSYGTSTPLVSSLVTGHTVLLSGLPASKLYHYRVKSRDAAGNLATSGDYTFTTGADTVAPTISGGGASSVTSSAATIHWVTSEASNTQVEYGLTTTYGSSSSLITTMVTTHSQVLSGLTAGKLYHYRAKSRDVAGNLATSGDSTFSTTAAIDAVAPLISRVVASRITASEAIINWTTDESSDGQLEYGTKTAYGSLSIKVYSLLTSHGIKLSGLNASTLYHYRIRSHDKAGNLASMADFTFNTAAADSIPPVISSVTAVSFTGREALITWTTNEASDSQAKWGLVTGYENTTPGEASLVLKHSRLLTGLVPGKAYHYRVRSRDAAGNLASSNDFIVRATASVSSAQTVTNFDHPALQGSVNGLLSGTFGGIDFGSGQWRWENSYGADATKNIYFDSAKGNSRTFAFSPAPKILRSLSVFALASGTLTLIDNLGQRKSQSVPTGPMQLVSTGWTKGSTTVTVSFTKGWNFGMDDITYGDVSTTAGLTIEPAADASFVISGVATPKADNAAANPSTDAVFLPSIVEGPGFRTNLGISNLSSSVTHVKLSLVDQEGNIQATKSLAVGPMGLQQINSVARVLLSDKLHSLIQGSLILESDQEICAWAVQINNSSNDPSFLQSRHKGSTKILIPSAANLTSFKSSLTVMNIGAVSAQVSLTSYDPGGKVLGQSQAPISVSPRGSIVLENVLETLGVKDSFGPLEITSLNDAPLLATSRVSGANESGGFFEGLDYFDASTAQIIATVVENADLRTNIGINNVNDGAVSVWVRLRSHDGSELGALHVVVPAKGLLQLNPAVHQMIGNGVAVDVEGYIELQSDHPILAWASEIDNVTNDPGFDVARRQGSNRVLLRSTNLGNFRSSLVVVNGNDAEVIVDIVSRDEKGKIQGQLRSLSIPARGYFDSANILRDLGILQDSGTIEVISTNRLPVVTTSRVYSNSRTSGFLGGQQLN